MAVAGRLLSRCTLLRGTLWRAILRACLCSTARLQTGSTSVFSAIKAATAQFTTVDKKRSDAEKNCALKQTLDNAIIADGVADAFALAGLDKPNIDLIADEFLVDAAAVEITEKLRASTTIDWQVRESVRAKLRILVRRCLQRWKYPPDQQADAGELVLKQAETLSSAWYM